MRNSTLLLCVGLLTSCSAGPGGTNTLGDAGTSLGGAGNSLAGNSASSGGNAGALPMSSSAGSGTSGNNSGAGGSNAGAGGAGGNNANGGSVASGGRDNAGAGGMSGAGGTNAAGAGPEVPARSAGCGAMNPATGERTITVADDTGQFIVSIPENYDPNNAYPLGFAFHGFGRTAADCQATDCPGVQSEWGPGAVVVYMRSLGEGWEQSEVRERNVAFFSAVLEQMKAEYCIDTSRVFVAGTSSGAHFTNVLGCRFADQLLAVAPVAGVLPETEGCSGRTSALVIHGIDDYHVQFSGGEQARDHYVALGGCSPTAVPDLATAHATVRAARDENRGVYECVDYPGCEDGLAVRWCEHSEGGYDDSTHGWPVVGGGLIWDFVQSL